MPAGYNLLVCFVFHISTRRIQTWQEETYHPGNLGICWLCTETKETKLRWRLQQQQQQWDHWTALNIFYFFSTQFYPHSALPVGPTEQTSHVRLIFGVLSYCEYLILWREMDFKDLKNSDLNFNISCSNKNIAAGFILKYFKSHFYY